jgi:hypothetical protein
MQALEVHTSLCVAATITLPPTNSEITLTYLQMWHAHQAHFTLGLRAFVQPKSSITIAAKVEISPGCFIAGVNADIESKLFNLPHVTNKC